MVNNLPKIGIINSSGFGKLFPDQLLALKSFANCFFVDLPADSPPEEIIQQLAPYEGIVIGNSPKLCGVVFSRLPNLRIICHNTIIADNIDLAAAKEFGINVRQIATNIAQEAVAEFAICLMLGAMRQIVAANNVMLKGDWRSSRALFVGSELKGKTVGLLGLGSSGGRVADILSNGFGSEVIAFDPFLPEDVFLQKSARRVSFSELIRRSQILSLHCPLNAATAKCIGAKELSEMQNGAILVNVSGGELVSEEALLDCLNCGKLGFYAADFLCGSSDYSQKLLKHPRSLILPQLGGYTYETLKNMGNSIVQTLKEAFVLHGQNTSKEKAYKNTERSPRQSVAFPLKTIIFWITFFILFNQTLASACPSHRGLIDYNCDGQFKVVGIGDSIVFGRGDLLNGNKGGYILRLAKHYKQAKFINLGRPGYTTTRLFREFKPALDQKKTNQIQEALKDADLILLDIGRNDFFANLTPEMTVRNIERIISLLRAAGRASQSGGFGVTPFVAAATLLPTTRGYQRSFIENTNQLLLKRAGKNLPIRFRFDLIPSEAISVDGIHPTSRGYSQISSQANAALKKRIFKEMLKDRPDRDKDGIFDMFESSRFKTSPSSTDSDNDGLLDGEEVFVFHTDPAKADTDDDGISDYNEIFIHGTDPLNPDTDGDGVSDGDEIATGRNPLDPNS
ncbi:MAG TPA: NAD(P)-dependent oxidoreductase [Oligoflexia bacterium]|nr:NAD(P)-dependent oxidoreductase [Oligoflexia bacterium]HMP26667.1 NAD(P)-dependent oxidoreductase [Oligoflexia bacterium]